MYDRLLEKGGIGATHRGQGHGTGGQGLTVNLGGMSVSCITNCQKMLGEAGGGGSAGGDHTLWGVFLFNAASQVWLF